MFQISWSSINNIYNNWSKLYVAFVYVAAQGNENYLKCQNQVLKEQLTGIIIIQKKYYKLAIYILVI